MISDLNFKVSKPIHRWGFDLNLMSRPFIRGNECILIAYANSINRV